MTEAPRRPKKPRASIRVGVLLEKAAPWGCWWTVSPPIAIRQQAMDWVTGRYGSAAIGGGGSEVFADTPGMVADLVLAFSRLKLGLPATRT